MWIPAGYAQINLKWTGPGVPLGAETTFGITAPVGALPSEVQVQVQSALQASEYTANLSNDVKITSLLVKMGPNETGAMAEFPTNYPGGMASVAVPPNTSLLVKKGTALGGRKAQGRYFIPGLPEAVVDSSGHVTQSHLDAIQTQQAEFLSALSQFQVAMYLLHTMPNSPVPPYAVMSLSPQPTVATQRRRLRH